MGQKLLDLIRGCVVEGINKLITRKDGTPLSESDQLLLSSDLSTTYQCVDPNDPACVEPLARRADGCPVIPRMELDAPCSRINSGPTVTNLISNGANPTLSAPASNVIVEEQQGVMVLNNPFCYRMKVSWSAAGRLLISFGEFNDSQPLSAIPFFKFQVAINGVWRDVQGLNHLHDDNDRLSGEFGQAPYFSKIDIGGSAVFDRRAVWTNSNGAGEDPRYIRHNLPSIAAQGVPCK